MSLANRFILAGVAYGLIGMLLGLMMGATRDFAMVGVHSHINLLGWVSMVLFGLIYRSFPAMASEALANLHFWLSNLGLIVMMLSLALLIKGNQGVAIILAVSEVAVIIAMFIFAWLFWKHRSE